jgi:hypothetical protein
MARLILILLLACGLYPVSSARADDPDPRAILQKAIDALGETLNGKRLAVHYLYRTKGRLGPSTLEVFHQPDGAVKRSSAFSLAQVKITTVFNGKKGWLRVDSGKGSKVTEFKDADYQAERRSAYSSRVGFMVDVLRDPAFSVTYLGEEKLGGQETLGVLVKSAGHPDFRMYFDKSTYLMAGVRHKDTRDGKEVDTETLFSDYRVLSITADEEKALKQMGVPVNGDGAVAHLRVLNVTDADMRKWIAGLGSAIFKEREQAARALQAQGPRAIPLLKEALKNPEAEVSRRAKACLDAVNKGTAAATTRAAVRLVGFARPNGAVEALLDYLPHVSDEAMTAEVLAVLAGLAEANGKPHPALVKALESKDKKLQEAAAAVLGRDGGAFLNKPGRRIYLPNSRYPARQVHSENGKTTGESQLLELDYFNRFEDSLFRQLKELKTL